MANFQHQKTRKILSRAAMSTSVVSVAVTLLSVAPAWAGTSSAVAKAESQAKTELITASKLPSGWKIETGSVTTSDSSGDNSGDSQLAKCLDVPLSVLNAPFPEADSPTFQNSSGSITVQDEVQVYPSVKVGKQQFNSFAQKSAPSCLGAYFKSQESSLGESLGGTVSSLKSTRESENFGSGISGVSVTFKVKVGSKTQNFSTDDIVEVKGTQSHDLTFTDGEGLIPPSDLLSIAKAAYTTLS